VGSWVEPGRKPISGSASTLVAVACAAARHAANVEKPAPHWGAPDRSVKSSSRTESGAGAFAVHDTQRVWAGYDGRSMRSTVIGFAFLVAACGDGGGLGGAPEGGSPNGGAASGGGAGGTGGSAEKAPLAAGCEADSDCETGLCLRPTDDVGYFRGGPANGYCSKSCVVQADCPAGVCRGEGGDAICLRTCETGEPPLTALNQPIPNDKCVGRDDLRCQPVGEGAEQVEVCIPTCGVDAQCPSGLVCDPLNRVCTSRPTGGMPFGAPCDQASGPACAGLCVGLSGFDDPNLGFCSQFCVFGGTDLEIDCGGTSAGACVFAPTNGLGDFALCTPACTAHADCYMPYMACRGLPGLTGEASDKGYCFTPDSCPNGRSDCGDFECVDTASGPLCLDPAFD